MWAEALVGAAAAEVTRDARAEELEECLTDLLEATADGRLTLTGPLAGLRRFIDARTRAYEAMRKEEPDDDEE